jgi:hypothetical protein
MDSLVATVFIVCIIASFGVAIGIGVRRAIRLDRSTESDGALRTPASGAFPVTVLTAGSTRRYRIVGVDSQTRADPGFHIEAATAANAKVKAELAGVIVTEVIEADGPPTSNVR